MGLCNDGSYSSSAEKKGACRGHKGVKEWYGDAAVTEPSKPSNDRASTALPSNMATPTTAKPTAPAAAPPIAGRTADTPTMSSTPAPGGGAGKVWANTSTKVYHCSGDKYYGTTKHGDYMSESDAKAKGYLADHGKACG